MFLNKFRLILLFIISINCMGENINKIFAKYSNQQLTNGLELIEDEYTLFQNQYLMKIIMK